MTHDEALARFLDRSLSEEGLLEFEALQAESPEFAGHVREMVALENILPSAAPSVNIPAHFLQRVEDGIATSLAAPQVISGLSHIWSWIGGGLAVAGVAGGIYLSSRSADQPAQPNPSIQVPVANAPAPSIASPVAAPVVQPLPSRTSSTAAVATPPSVKPAPQTASGVSTVANASGSDVVKGLEAEYTKYVSDGNPASACQTAIAIGKQLRTEGKLVQSEEYLNKAVQHATTTRIANWQMTALIELARTTDQLGNAAKSMAYAQEALKIGESGGLDVASIRTFISSLESKK